MVICSLRILGFVQAFALCHIKDYNLSYESLTSVQARNHLWGLKTTDPAFWLELTLGETNGPTIDTKNGRIPDDDEKLPDDGPDDSDVACTAIISQTLNAKAADSEHSGLAVTESGRLSSSAVAEAFEAECVEEDDANLGRGRHRKTKNWLYMSEFWKYDETSDSD